MIKGWTISLLIQNMTSTWITFLIRNNHVFYLSKHYLLVPRMYYIWVQISNARMHLISGRREYERNKVPEKIYFLNKKSHQILSSMSIWLPNILSNLWEKLGFATPLSVFRICHTLPNHPGPTWQWSIEQQILNLPHFSKVHITH